MASVAQPSAGGGKMGKFIKKKKKGRKGSKPPFMMDGKTAKIKKGKKPKGK